MMLQRAFDTACIADPARRRLTRIDLFDVAERLLRPGQLAFIKAVAAQDRGGSIGVWVTPLTAPPTEMIGRDETVSPIITAASGEAILWLHGANGVGKSTLATLIASEYGGEWLYLDLRLAQDDRRTATAAWHQLAWALDEGPAVSGVVIDDCNNQAFDALRSRISPLARALSGRGARIIVTSSHDLPPARQAEMGLSQRAVWVAPYFTINEISALITLRDGPTSDMVEAWANLVSFTTSGGHRSWSPPRAEALTEDILGRPSEAVVVTREEARRRLLADLSSQSSRELLRRISCVFDRADDGLIRAIAKDPPHIDGVGDSLAMLRGSWIEVTNDGYLRISPLIADLSADATGDERRRWHRIGAVYWITKGPLNERTLPLCFWSAFLGEEILVLAKVCQLFEALPKEHIQSAAAALSPVVALRTDGSILPNHPEVAPLVRLLQFTVADAIEDEAAAQAAAERLLVEIDECPIEELRSLNTSIAAFKVVTSESTEIPAAIILEYVLRAREVATHVEALGARRPDHIPVDVGLAGFIFAFFTVRLRTSQRLEGLIAAMDALNEGDRGWLLDAVSASLDGLGILFQSPWANEQLAGGDAQATLTRYGNIAGITTEWRRADVTIEVACARSVILDEMIGDKARAIVTIDEAIETVGPDWRLVQQKAKVLAHDERHEDALSLYASVESQIVGKGFDRAMALRGGALSAASLTRFEEAARLIHEARSALEGNPYFQAVSAGFLIDEALAQWRAKNRRAALVTIADALDAVASIDPSVSRQNERAHQLVRYVVGVFWDEIQPFPRNTPKLLQFGQASALAGDEELQNIDFKPLPDLWRLLAVVEAEAGIDAGIDQISLARQNGASATAMEMAIAEARYARSLANEGDLSKIIGLGLTAVSIAATAIDMQRSGGAQRMEPQVSVSALRIRELLSGKLDGKSSERPARCFRMARVAGPFRRARHRRPRSSLQDERD
ncbi:MAG: hypothetical protein J0H08_14780 [Rhizobiales bacterium]|nr:hypothetical protein [Hyphomicrobiales bacterium]